MKTKVLKAFIKVILALAIMTGVIVSLVLLSELNFKISGTKDYIFYIIPNFNFFILMVGEFLLIIILIFLFDKNKKLEIKNEYINDNDQAGLDLSLKKNVITEVKEDIENNLNEESMVYSGARILSSKIGKFTVIAIMLLLFIISLIVSLGCYDVVSEDKLVRKRVFFEEEYKYEDIDFVMLGISSGRKLNSSVNLYYDIYLNNGKRIRILNSSFDTKEDIDYELVVEKFDNFIKLKNINRKVDLAYVEKFKKQNYDEEYEKNILRILGVTNDRS